MIVSETTYGDIEAVTRELINMAAAQHDDFGLIRARHLDTMFRAIAERPVAVTPELVRADVDDALHCFDANHSGT